MIKKESNMDKLSNWIVNNATLTQSYFIFLVFSSSFILLLAILTDFIIEQNIYLLKSVLISLILGSIASAIVTIILSNSRKSNNI
jgi:hypothetical protein